MAKDGSHARWSLQSYGIGMKLRDLRTRKRLTLARLAAETGLSTALLSKLETDRMIPTLPTLATICRVFGVGLSHFFNEPTKHSLSISRRTYLQSHAQHQDGVKRIPLSAPGSDHALHTELIEILPGSSSVDQERGQRQSRVIYVLAGRLTIAMGNVEEVLETGDCACMESEMATGWSATDGQMCRVLVVSPRAAAR
ncbi:MAG TPA: XRE family transcriptional regulator [Terracidiphilus sp.]|nr:XRE family transcriptional regulator [Terracidiphilus sp.]